MHQKYITLAVAEDSAFILWLKLLNFVAVKSNNHCNLIIQMS